MNYAVDQGNTNIKLGIFEDDRLVDVASWRQVKDLQEYFAGLTPGNVIISSVSGNSSSLAAILGHGNHKVLQLNKSTPLPILNSYRSPNTLGMDRIAAVCGARVHFPQQNCLVVDFGTCVTYDLIDERGSYLGGAISPGFNMRFKAMNAFTSTLPLIEEIGEQAPEIGQTTDEAMTSGVLYGMLGELEKFIDVHRKRFNDLQIVFCGGDYQRFESRLKESIFAAPNLVLEGLNSILRHNDEELE